MADPVTPLLAAETAEVIAPEVAGGTAKGAAGAGADALAPAALGAGDAAAAGATGAGAGALDAVAAGLTPSGGATALGTAEMTGAGLGAGAGVGLGDALGAAGGASPLDTAAYPAGPMGAPGAAPGATPTIAAPAAPTPTGGLSAGGLSGPSGGSGADVLAGGTGAAPLDSSTVAGGAGRTAESGGGIGDLVSRLGQGATDQITKNPLGILAGGIPLAASLMKKPSLPQQPNMDALVGQEKQLAQQQMDLSRTLTDPLTSGHLPAGAETQVSNAFNDAISSTKARYANLGLSGSTMEADAIASVTSQREALTFQIAQQMAQTGQAAVGQAAGAMGLQDQVYNQLMQAQISQDKALQDSIARFASAASGGGRAPTIQIGGTSTNTP